MDAQTDTAEDLELLYARGKARFKEAAGYLHASRETGLPDHERAAYLAAWRKARGEAEDPDGPGLLCTISHDVGGCAEPDVSIGSIEHQFESAREEMQRGSMMEASEGREEAIFADDSPAAITGRATIRYVAFLRAELDRLPSRHPLHRRYSEQVRRLEARLGPIAHA